MPFLQTMSNNNSENLDKKVDRNFVECSSSRLYSRFQLLNDLSTALYNRFEQLGGIEYLEESITCWRQILNLYSIEDPNRLVSLSNFAAAIITRFKQLGRTDDLEESPSSNCSPTSRSSSFLLNLANAVFTRFQQSGRMEGDLMLSSSTCSLPSQSYQSFIVSPQPFVHSL